MKKLLALFIVLSILVPVVFAQEAGEKGTFTWSGVIRAEYYAADTALGTSGMTGDSAAEVVLTYNKDIVTVFGALGGAFTAGSTTLMSPYATFGGSATNDLFKVNLALKSSGLNFTNSNFGFGYAPIDSLYGWIYLVPGQLRIDAAYKGWDEVKWGTPSALDTNYDQLDGKSGLRLVYTPSFLTGLSAGIAVLPMPVQGNPWLGTWFSAGTVLGIKYDLAPLTASFAMKIKESVAPLDIDQKSKARVEGIIAGAKYFVIPETLSIGADTAIHTVGNFTDYADKSYADINVDIGFGLVYTQGAVKEAAIKAKLLQLGQKIPDSEAYFTPTYSGESYNNEFVLNPYIQYYLVEKVSLVKLALTLTAGLSEYAYDDVTYTISKPGKASNLKVDLGYFHSLKGDVTDGLGDYSGFMAKYGVKFDFSDADLKPVNDLTVGIRWAF
jgi:hypothetical protein